jgi:murein DD-endopeptidase MepM/ murein hydrolase activator NlpD
MPRSAVPHAVPRPRVPGLLTLATPLLLAGLLPMPVDVSSRWGWSGSWLQPVGDPYVTPTASADGGSEYRAMRGVGGATEKDRGHQGADLSNGRGGGIVRAAGNGLVVKVGGKGWNRGYGRHVVLAHQLAEGALAYSVYAHLAAGSVTVRRGDFVGAGHPLGKVGMTGRATSPHLHFEVRLPEDPHARWEHAPAVDPLAFVAARLPTPRADSSWSRPYLQWAECAGLIRPGDDGDRRPSRAEWWRAILLATRHPLASVPASGESLRSVLIGIKLLPEDPMQDADDPLRWGDLARDLPRARALGLRLPSSPVTSPDRAQICRRELGTGSPASEPDALAKARDGGPTRAEMCLVLADLAGDPPPKPRSPRRRPKAPAPAG